MLRIEERLQRKLLKRKKHDNLRSLNLSSDLIDFFSNDYLGLARSEALASNIKDHFSKLKPVSNGSTGSRLLSGNSDYAMDLEEDLAVRFKTEKTLLFNSGYTANLALISTIPQRGDTIVYDQRSHACIKEAARLSYAKHYSFRHNDMPDLQKKLERAEGQKFVVTESLYSMEGDFLPINEVAAICARYQVHLIVDEAHTTGWMGENGAGYTIAWEKEHEVLARVHTFGKALGVHGACVAGPAWLIEYLVNFARPFIYTTAMPMHSLVAIRCAYEYIDINPQCNEKLLENIEHFSRTHQDLSWEKGRSNNKSPIQKLLIGENKKAIKVAAFLKENGLDTRAILPPTVDDGAAVVRICLHAFNSTQQIDKLRKTLTQSL